jgi:uncharacterized protein (TIGR02118 family)
LESANYRKRVIATFPFGIGRRPKAVLTVTHGQRPPAFVVPAVNKVLVLRPASRPVPSAAGTPPIAMPGLRRVRTHDVLSAVTRPHAPSAPLPVGGVDELWTDAAPPASLALVRGAYGDEPLVQVSAVREAVVFARPHPDDADLTRRLSLLQRQAGLSRAAFSRYWEQVHAPLTHCHRHVARYVQNHVLDTEGADAASAGAFDGMAEFEVGDVQGMESDYLTPEGLRMRQDVARFAATVSTYWVRTREWRLPA